MAVGLLPPDQIQAIDGVKLSTASAGLRYQGRDDLLLIEINPQASLAAVFTQNKFRAAPVELCVRNLASAMPRYLLINAGNANAGTGNLGLANAEEVLEILADQVNVKAEQILPFSTGVIGEQLDIDKISKQLPALVENLKTDHWLAAAHAIMTTDTVAKGYSKQIMLSAGLVNISGIAKGSGMIQPDMATMLAYTATDLTIEQNKLQELLCAVTDNSFNSITVDGDTSTNDSSVLIATGTSGITFNELSIDDQGLFIQALHEIMQLLAQAIIRDGEGVSKYITIEVAGAKSQEQANKVAFAIANSPLVKTALAASDPNWGRIMAAVGNAKDKELNMNDASLVINDLCIWQKGALSLNYTEEQGKQAMLADEITIQINLALGEHSKTVWTTDLTHEYIRINAEYRT